MKFNELLGNETVKEHLSGLVQHDRLGHAYIFEGENGLGKKTAAKLLAKALLCTGEGEKPCDVCRSCRMVQSGNHPDLISVFHEKPKLIKVSEIREQVINGIEVKPYYNGKKIYIIPDAGLMNANAQNAILKTIEEPPEYVLMILLTENREWLLPTILSRCVTLSFRPLSVEQVKKTLISRYDLSAKDAGTISALSHGNLGKAVMMSRSEEFAGLLEKILKYLREPRKMSSSEVFAFAKEMAEEKERLDEVLDIMLFWYRDILMVKTAGKSASLTFVDETGYIDTRAEALKYEEIEKTLSGIRLTRQRLQANASAEAGMDVLLLSMRG